MGAVGVGFGLGFFVALQVGPMSLFLIRSTLRSGLAVGLAIAAGIALVDALYAAAGALGAAGLVHFRPVRTALGLIGAGVLLFIGVRIIGIALHPPEQPEGRDFATRPRRAFLTAFGATASNPMTIVSWAAIFGAASVAIDAAPWLLILGVALGSGVWMTSLACAVAVVRRRASATVIRWIDAVAGVGMIAFAGFLAYSSI